MRPDSERRRPDTVVLGALPEAVSKAISERTGAAVRTVEAPEAVETVVGDTAVRALIVVHSPGTTDRLAAIETFADRYPSIPVVAFVQDDDPAVGSAVVAAGADDFVPAAAVDDPGADLVDRLPPMERSPVGTGGETRFDLFDSIADPAVIQSVADSEIRSVNAAFCSQFGHDREALLGRTIGEIAASERIETSPEERVRKVLADGEHTFEWVTRREDGGTVPTEVTLSTLEIDGRECVLWVIRDISDRKANERELGAERALTEALFAALPDVFYAFDETGQFLRWNDELTETTGYDDAEIESMHPVELFPESEQARITREIAEVVEHDTTVTVEAPFLTKDGELIPHEFTGGRITDENGETIGLVGIGRNIADRRERQRRFEAVFNNTYQFTGLLDPSGRLVEINDAALEFGGLDRESVIGRAVWDVSWFAPYEESIEAVKEAVERARNGDFYRTELTVQGKNGSEIIDFSVRPIADDEGNVTLLVPEGRTITELKRRERHLDVLHRFLRHNLRNKLTVIDGNAGILRRELEGTENESYAALIEGAASDLIELGETAHKLSKLVAKAEGDRRPVDVEAIVSHLSTEFHEEYPEASVNAQAGASGHVMADWRLEAVLEQLIENAIEHTREEPTVEISVTDSGDSVSVAISDDGPGIPEEELVGITTDEEPTPIAHGTGFGLWLVRSVLDDYGAELSYEPNEAGGSTLIVTLPKAPERPVGGRSMEYSEP